jgi:GrpB-like predicted nucleotidyltransferase (UPF0157 family)
MSAPAEWPVWATEDPIIVEPSPDWLARGRRLSLELADTLGPMLVADVEHMGSTAVPGLAAKPIIDLMAGVASLDAADAIAQALAPALWHFVPPDLDQRPWRRFFVKVEQEHRAAHLHVMDPASPRWHEQLAFRDALRADADLAAEYSSLKRTLSDRHRHDREAYSEAKGEFISRVLSTRE